MLTSPISAFKAYVNPNKAPISKPPLSAPDTTSSTAVVHSMSSESRGEGATFAPVFLVPVLWFVPFIPVSMVHPTPKSLPTYHKKPQGTPSSQSSSITTTHRPDVWENPIPLRQLLPKDLTKVNFQQGAIGNCYLLAGLDSIIHHPKGEELLNQIIVEECRTPKGRILKYKVTFPSGRWGAFFADELGMPKCGKKPLSGPDAIRMIELAYAKMTRKKRNHERSHPFENGGRGLTPVIAGGGSAKRALLDLFPGESVVVSPGHPAPAGYFVKFTEPLRQNPRSLEFLEKKLTLINGDKKHDYFLSAYTPQKKFFSTVIATQQKSLPTGEKPKWFYRYHVYGIRSFDLDKKTITVANPHDTKAGISTLTFEEFCDVFQGIEGIKLPATASEP